ncbi:hypothetical protein N7489_008558, partial [Penicillium chrysogenum]
MNEPLIFTTPQKNAQMQVLADKGIVESHDGRKLTLVECIYKYFNLDTQRGSLSALLTASDEHGPVWWWSWSCGVRCGSRDHPDLPETLTIYGRVTIRSLCAQAPNTPPLAPQPAHLQQPYCASEVEVTSTVVAGQPNLRSDSVTIRRSLQPPPS